MNKKVAKNYKSIEKKKPKQLTLQNQRFCLIKNDNQNYLKLRIKTIGNYQKYFVKRGTQILP